MVAATSPLPVEKLSAMTASPLSDAAGAGTGAGVGAGVGAGAATTTLDVS
jgi:hypothetical protein